MVHVICFHRLFLQVAPSLPTDLGIVRQQQLTDSKYADHGKSRLLNFLDAQLILLIVLLAVLVLFYVFTCKTDCLVPLVLVVSHSVFDPLSNLRCYGSHDAIHVQIEVAAGLYDVNISLD